MASRSRPRVIILGAGPAGLGAAYRLRRDDQAEVTVLEQHPVVGGNAGSFVIEEQRVDFGSHRLHPSCAPKLLTDIRAFLGAALLDRPRHGRIRLRGQWLHFPLKPLDMLRNVDAGFLLGSARDALTKPFRAVGPQESFASVLWASLGPTVCRNFYFPYARKIWGVAPEALSAIQARRRVSAASFTRLAKKVVSQLPGVRRPGAGRFFYPREGFGQISEAYADAARQLGASICLGRRVVRAEPPTGARPRWRVTVESGNGADTIEGEYVWSTIPLPILGRALSPSAPAEVLAASERIRYRGMLLIYMTLPVDQFTPYDAHYFPEGAVSITRLSEPKNYAARPDPVGRTTLCAELPADPADPVWEESDAALGKRVAKDLATAGLPVPAPPVAVHVRRLRHAYPIYHIGYEEPFGVLDRWAETLPQFVTFGRQGLFAHDNTHHALYMAYAAADCLTPSGWDASRWATYRQEFASHVVED